MWNLKNKQTKTKAKQTSKQKLIERDQTCGYQGQGDGRAENQRKVAKRHTVPAIRQVSMRDVMSNMMTRATTAVWSIAKA